MVNNFDLIRPILDWGGELDFYTVGLILRKKDQTTSYGNKNNSARIIKMYYFFEEKQFNEKEAEIKALCEEFGCRAGIYLNKRNLKDMAYDMMISLAQILHDGSYRRILGLFDTVVGTKQSRDKIKFLDCDSKEEYEVLKRLLNDPSLRPHGMDKIIAEVPTNSGYHLVVRRFDSDHLEKLIATVPNFKFDINSFKGITDDSPEYIFDEYAFKQMIQDEADFDYDYEHGKQVVNPVALYYPLKNDIDKAAREIAEQ